MSFKASRASAGGVRARSISGSQQQAQLPGPINHLTSILLLDIFAHVRSVQGLATCSLVCRQWHALTWAYALEMDLSAFQNGTKQVLPVNDTKLVYLSALSPSVRHLSLRHMPQSAELTKSIVLPQYPIQCIAITDEGIASLTTLNNLRSLLLQGCRLLTDKALRELVKMAVLEKLDLTGLNGLSSAGLRQLGSIVHLQHLTLHGIDTVDDRVLESLSHLKFLKHLDISACVGVGEDGIKHLGTVRTITSLNLSGNSRLGQQRAWNHLINLINLEQLKVKSVVFSEDQMDDFCQVLPRWKKLIELRMGFCQIRDQHCAAFGSLPQLRVLSLHNASALKAESYSHFSKVTDLDLSRSSIPVHALEHLSRLVRLELKNSKLLSVTELRQASSPQGNLRQSRSSSVASPSSSVSARSSQATSPSSGDDDFRFLSTSPLSFSPSSSMNYDEDFAEQVGMLPSPATSPLTSPQARKGALEWGTALPSAPAPSLSSSTSSLNPTPPSSSALTTSLSSSLQRLHQSASTSAMLGSPPISLAASSSSSVSSPSLTASYPGLLASSMSSVTLDSSASSSTTTNHHSRHRKKSLPNSFETSPAASSSSPPSMSPSLPRAIPKRRTSESHSNNYLAQMASPSSGVSSPPSTSPFSPPTAATSRTEMVEVRPLECLKHITTLHRLSLRVENMTDKDLSAISKCRKLRELDLLWLSTVSSRGLQKLGRLRLLQSLNLTNCKSLTNETLQVILPNMRWLKALSLAHCTLISDPGLHAIAAYSARLRYLVLFQLQLITNEGARSLVTLRDLEVLEISGCTQVDVPVVQSLLKEYLPALYINHNAHTKDSSGSSTHCVVS